MKRFFTNRYVLIAIVLVIVTEVLLCLLTKSNVLSFKNEVTFSAFTVIPLFIIAFMQLIYNGRLQKTDFVRDYSEEFFTNEALYSAFHELIYTYRDSDFDAVEKAVQNMEGLENSLRPIKIPVERSIGKDTLNCPLYHPKYFQGSCEERRLDMLIGYFDLLGYHYDRGFVTMDDLVGSLGHYLNILSRRKVVQCMREAYREAIQDSAYSKVNGRIRPFAYFDRLMIAIEAHNAAIEGALRKELKLS